MATDTFIEKTITQNQFSSPNTISQKIESLYSLNFTTYIQRKLHCFIIVIIFQSNKLLTNWGNILKPYTKNA